MSAPARIGIMPAGPARQFGPDLRAVLALATRIEAAGFDDFLLGDHVVMGDRLDRYPYGAFSYGAHLPPIAPHEPWLDVLTTLAVVAGCTTSLGLVPGVLLAPLRPAVLLAKSAATLDVLSGGRLELGIGVGWQREEYDALGIPFAHRWTRAEDTLAACRALWEQLPASVATSTVTFTDVYAAPQPARRIPITIGASATDATVQRIARWADGWFPLGVDPAGLREGVARVRAGFAEAGRDPGSLVVRAQGIVRMRGGAVDAARMADELVELRRSGATAVWYALSPGLGISGLDAADEVLHAIAAAVGAAARGSIT